MMKQNFKFYIGGILVLAMVFGLMIGFTGCIGCAVNGSDTEATAMSEEDEEMDYEDADDFYGDLDDDILDDEDAEALSAWGDGTCRPINTKEFYQLVASKDNAGTYIGEGPCVIDFWADWCGYCKQIDPYMKALAKKYKGKVQFYKVDADACPELLEIYGINGLPTIFFCSGENIQMTSGADSQEEFDKKIQSIL
ncbi:MAG: thioredoxin family protein [Bacteroidales bacterium]|nr:thioredoxin family protein [Bacteroidales bacterium]